MNNILTAHKQPVPYKEIIVYYVLACAFSWPFFAWRDLFPESWQEFSFHYKNMLYMWGPAVSALICFGIFRKSHKQTIFFFGNNWLKSVLFYVIPCLTWFIAVQIFPSQHDLPPLKFLSLFFTGFLMILGEELGWRGFLQDSLRNLKEPLRWIILGLMWEMWHFTRGIVNAAPVEIVIRKMVMIVMVIALAFIIGKLTDRTRSLIVAITLHAWFNILFESPVMSTYITMGLNIVLWFLMLRKWKV